MVDRQFCGLKPLNRIPYRDMYEEKKSLEDIIKAVIIEYYEFIVLLLSMADQQATFMIVISSAHEPFKQVSFQKWSYLGVWSRLELKLYLYSYFSKWKVSLLLQVIRCIVTFDITYPNIVCRTHLEVKLYCQYIEVPKVNQLWLLIATKSTSIPL